MALRLILASASASRRALLATAGIGFEIHPAEADETANQARRLEAGGSAPRPSSS
jgi:predicted house-cleaning NTP pyrophosphatase (Maf/HAM1 superfamily)